MGIFESICRLASYGITTGLIQEEDLVYVKNRMLEVLGLEGFENAEQTSNLPDVKVSDLEEILKDILDYAVEKNLTGGESVVYRDLFDTKLMSIMVDKPSHIIRKFKLLYEKSPKEATNWFYKFSQDTDYIRR